MNWKEISDLGVVAVLGAFGLKLFFEYLRWQSKYLVDRSLDPLEKTVDEFKTFVGNHLEHQQQEHKAIMTTLERVLDKVTKRED